MRAWATKAQIQCSPVQEASGFVLGANPAVSALGLLLYSRRFTGVWWRIRGAPKKGSQCVGAAVVFSDSLLHLSTLARYS
jgi:hypothetical protein